jgi:integration host factor subunit beta
LVKMLFPIQYYRMSGVWLSDLRDQIGIGKAYIRDIKNMLKKDLIDEVTAKMDGYLKKDIGQAVDILLDTIVEALIAERRVEIRGFGSFSVRKRKARSTKNPKTGEVMNIPERKTLHFTMSKSLKEPLAGKK